MVPPLPALGPAFQLGVVVRDIEAAMDHWRKVMNVGPFIYMENPGDQTCTYRGAPTEVKVHIAFTYSGDMQIELIQQINDTPSPYTDFLAAGREGIQHLAFYANDMAAACQQLENNGLERVYTIQPKGGDEHIYYYEDHRQVGAMSEILPLTPLRRRFHGAILAATKGWEGARPIRRYDSIAHYMEASGLLEP
jgi:hypothetical protein